MAKLPVLIAGLLLIAESQASDVTKASPSTGFLSKYVTAATQRTPTSNVKHGYGPDKEEEKAAEKLLANGSNTPTTLSAIGVGLLALVTMLAVRIQRGLRPATMLASSSDNIMEMKSQGSSMNGASFGQSIPETFRQFRSIVALPGRAWDPLNLHPSGPTAVWQPAIFAVDAKASEDLDGAGARIGIIKTKENPSIVNALADDVKKACLEAKVSEENTFETQVPGAWNLPSAARFLALSGRVDAIVCIGYIGPDDPQNIADPIASGLMSVQLQTSVPCTLGVISAIGWPNAASTAASWGKDAVEMAVLRQEALGLAKKGTINLGFSEEESTKAMPKVGVGEKKVFF